MHHFPTLKKLFWLISYDESFLPYWKWSLPGWSSRLIFQADLPVHRAQGAWGVTEWFDGYESYVHNMLFPSQSPDLNPAEHIWIKIINCCVVCALQKWYQNINWGVIFWCSSLQRLLEGWPNTLLTLFSLWFFIYIPILLIEEMAL